MFVILFLCLVFLETNTSLLGLFWRFFEVITSLFSNLIFRNLFLVSESRVKYILLRTPLFGCRLRVDSSVFFVSENERLRFAFSVFVSLSVG